jgi:multidrug transporter EmrE-like cation transporter
MFDSRLWIGVVSRAGTRGTTLALLLANLVFNIVSNASFKMAALTSTWRGFLAWQVVGNLAGFITVLTLTGMLRFIPLGVAFTVTTGLAVLGVQVAASGAVFHERITSGQWLGTLLVVAGIILVGRR